MDMLRSLRTYRDVGYQYMVMPDHVPRVAGRDPEGVAFSYCYGYITALMQALDEEKFHVFGISLGGMIAPALDFAREGNGEPFFITLYPVTHGSYVVTQALEGIHRGLLRATPLLLAELATESVSARRLGDIPEASKASRAASGSSSSTRRAATATRSPWRASSSARAPPT